MVPENTKINIINNIKTSMEMENQNLSANDISLLNDFADNKISMEDAMQSIKQFYKKFSKNVNKIYLISQKDVGKEENLMLKPFYLMPFLIK